MEKRDLRTQALKLKLMIICEAMVCFYSYIYRIYTVPSKLSDETSLQGEKNSSLSVFEFVLKEKGSTNMYHVSLHVFLPLPPTSP